VPHVELSLTDASATSPPAVPADADAALMRWCATVADAEEPCLVLDAQAVIAAASVSAAGMLGLGPPAIAHGQLLRDVIAPLIDFTAARAPLDDVEINLMPPLLAISSGRMARGLIRMASPDTGTVSTLDAITTPLVHGTKVIGSLTFFARI
jgi:hypothetical protein